ncbi:MAG: putative Methyltransferase FkbM family [Fibrobacteres bacterium]|nr:putative Methyltransferase FkbM family [Fibrobacterota bacterium]
MPYRLENVLKTYLHLENYPARIGEMLRMLPKGESEYRLRNGLKFAVRRYTSDGSCVVDVTREDEYFKHFGIFPGDIVVDIGSNIGSFSVYAGWLQPTARVLAVEPLQANYDLLSRNVRLNGLKNVETFRCGIMAKAGEIEIYHGTNDAEASSSVVASGVVDKSKVEKVPCISFVELLDKVPRVDFLKIDCEGAEFDFLPDAPSATMKKVRKLAMEYHDVRKDLTHKDLVRKLESEGFRVTVEPPLPGKDIGLMFAVAGG